MKSFAEFFTEQDAVNKARSSMIKADGHDLWMNVTDSSEQTSPAGSWINYWKEVTGGKASTCCDETLTCCVKGCTKEAEHGAHVWQRKGGPQYIVPMCASHNEQKGEGEFRLKQGTVLVPVPSDTK